MKGVEELIQWKFNDFPKAVEFTDLPTHGPKVLFRVVPGFTFAMAQAGALSEVGNSGHQTSSWTGVVQTNEPKVGSVGSNHLTNILQQTNEESIDRVLILGSPEEPNVSGYPGF